ncbi:alanine racemase [Herbiconiux sp. CPCC 205763]|uniref:Alanine racemase n=1 Tax=Herbiconiux aconitum TaxID=2970913 RepID=A0ABT2GVW8_9MICO|nr:alanine racemase [Herbiconiux aconitum]MCS5720356.1 alanine racemase [Herbiconiux aconitum]
MMSLPSSATAASGPLLTIDLDAVAANTRFFAARSAGELMAVVKADGYGHGAVPVARTALANGATRLGVASIDEALALRRAGIATPITCWLTHPGDDYRSAVDSGVDLAVPSVEHLRSIVATTGVARVHLHLDTGMARDGAEPTRWIELCREAKEAELAGRIRVVGLMGHLADGDDPGAPTNRLGRALFEWGLDVARLSGLDPHILHLTATSATLTQPSGHFTACRVGAGLVGIDLSRTARLEPAMTLTAPLLLVRKVSVGTPVGYGHDWVAPRSTRLGLIGLGYADGLPRSATGRAEVQVRGRRHPVVGRMSMDQAVIDLGDSGADVGESVTVFGPGGAGEPTVADWADWAGTIEHEIVTGVGDRVRRRTVGGSRRGTGGELAEATGATDAMEARPSSRLPTSPASRSARESVA